MASYSKLCLSEFVPDLKLFEAKRLSNIYVCQYMVSISCQYCHVSTVMSVLSCQYCHVSSTDVSVCSSLCVQFHGCQKKKRPDL